MLAHDLGHIRHSLLDLDKRFLAVLFFVQLNDFGRAHALVQRSSEDRDDTREPRGDVGNEGKGEGVCGGRDEGRKMSGGFTLVNVVSKRVRTDAALEVLSRLLSNINATPNNNKR